MITNKFIFIHIPKTGGQFIRGIIDQAKNKIKIYSYDTHATLDKSKNILKKFQEEDVKSFCIVRNPWDWYVSRFFYRKKMLDNNQIEEVIPLERVPSTKEGFQKHIKMLDDSYKKNEVFKGRSYVGITLTGYHNYLVGDNEIDKIGFFENLNEDLYNILFEFTNNKIFKRIIMKNKKANWTKHLHYSYYYDDCTKDIVYNWDENYIKTFNYSFENNEEV